MKSRKYNSTKESFVISIFFLVLMFFCSGLLSSCMATVEANDKSEVKPIGLSIKSLPHKTEYTVGENFSSEGLLIYAKYSDNSQKMINNWTLDLKNGTTLKEAGTITVTISYSEGANEVTEKFSIVIKKSNSSSENSSENNSGDSENTDKPSTDNPNNTPAISPSVTKAKINQFFWGTWQRMDNGNIYVIDDFKIVEYKSGNFSSEYKNVTSNEDSLSVQSLGTFQKKSASVIQIGAIPYFRKGGANLEYTMKLVGFEESVSRATNSIKIENLKITQKSEKYTSFENETKSSTDGTVKLIAPVKGDIQTIFVNTSENSLIVVPDIVIENSGSNMGTIPLSSEGQYCLKITGKIPEEEKDDGYLYGNDYKTYPITLTITNIGNVKSNPSTCSIGAFNSDSKLSITSSDDTNLAGVSISTMKPGATKTIKLNVKYGLIQDAYIDTGINITVTNAATGQKWVDFVPLRFYKGLLPITIAAKNTEHNSNSALNGFAIYPDGNSQFFTVPHGETKTIYVPSFGNTKPYLLAFSGATVSGDLNTSSEMFYSVAVGSSSPKEIEEDLGKYYNYGEGGGSASNRNDNEDKAYQTENNFEAYLEDEDIDYFKIFAKNGETVLPNGNFVYSIRYINEKGKSPVSAVINQGESISVSHLPEPPAPEGYDFCGWYIGELKIETGYIPKSNITLHAKWTPTEYKIAYNLNGGVNTSENPESYTIENSEIILAKPSKTGYEFAGWYLKEDFSGEKIEKIDRGSTGKITLYAKWSLTNYSITYNLNGGSFDSPSTSNFTIESDQIKLDRPKRNGYTFKGWYSSSNFSGNSVSSIDNGSYGNKTFWAQWSPTVYTITYNLNGGTNPSGNPTTYTIESSEIKLLGARNTNSAYTFAGWYTNALFEGKAFTKIESGSYGNISLWANWSTTKFTISYELNGGRVNETLITEYDYESEEIILPIPEKDCYIFDGWYFSSNFSENPVLKITKGSLGNKSLYAKWTPISYPIRYELNGGTNSDTNPNTYTIESSEIILNSPSKTGYTFAGWYEKSDFSSNPIQKITQNSTGEKTFYAKWDIVSYEIIYELNGGEFSSDVINSYTIESPDFTLCIPKKTGYIFNGWYTTSDFRGNPVISLQCSSIGKKKFYAKWEIETYSISYNLNGGNNDSSNPNNYTVNTNTITLKNPSRTGYSFAGWFEDSDFSTSISQIVKGSTEAKSLYAKWSPILYSISYYPKESNNTANPIYYTIESETIYLDSPSKEGYEFAGWFDNSSFSGNAISEIKKGSFGNIELFARWFIGVKYNTELNILDDLDLSSYTESFELFVSGTIDNNILKAIAKKIETVSVPVILNLKTAVGITEYTCNSSILIPCTNLKSIILPSCLTYIGDGAFTNCTSLEIIEIPDSVTKLGSYTFYGCTNVKELNLPHLFEFGPHCFDSCLNKVIYDDKYHTWKVSRTSYDSPVHIYLSLFIQYDTYKDWWWKH